MTHGSWPAAVSFDPEGGGPAYWEEALATGERPRALILISGEAARYSGWSARAVIALADALAARGPVILADLHFEQPELDGLVNERNAEGVADAILFGASLERVVRPVEGHRFEVVPAGGPVADAEAVLRSHAWEPLFEEAARRDATVILYTPWRARGMEAIGARADRTIMLGGNTDVRLASGYLPPDFPITAVLAPSTPRAGTTPPTVADAVVASSSTPQRRWAPIVSALGLAAAAVAAFVLWPRGGGAPAAVPTDPAPATATASVPTAEPAGVELPFAVAIEAHPDLATAANRIAELTVLDAAGSFFLAPILSDTTLYYRVMAGPVADSATAAALMADLIARGVKTGGTDWDIRNAPLAFDLGMFDTRAAADVRAAELTAQLIPSYVLAVPYDDGSERYRVYCGAWAGPAEADVMRQLLEAAAVDATLVQRIGRSTS